MPHPCRPLILVCALLAGVVARAEPTSDQRWRLDGFVDGYFAFNVNRPQNGANFITGTGTSAKRANEFAINQAVVALSRRADPLGFTLAFGFGTGFEVLRSAEVNAPGIGPQVWRHLLTASISYRAPVGRGLILEGGVYPSHIGLESFQSKDNWTYTRGWMGEFSPYYQTGLKAAYAFSDVFSAQLHLVNGWQNIGENNEGKGVGTQFTWTFKRVTFSLNSFAGPELTNDGRGWRLFVDAVAIVRATERLSFAFTSDFGRQGRPGLSSALWYAAAANVRYLLHEKLAVAARLEGYRDAEGVITGVAQTLTEVTTTLEYRPVDALILKLEGRYDHSTSAVFERRSDGPVPNQGLVLLGAVATY